MGMFAFGGGGVVLGIDIGNSAVKLVQLKASKGGSPELIGYGMAPLPEEAFHDGSITDAGVIADAIKSVIQENKLNKDRVFASISGQNVIMRFTKLPQMNEEELETTVRIEAEQYVPYAIEEVSIAHSVLNTVDDGEEGGGKFLILLVVAQKEIVNSYTDVLTQAGIKPEIVDVDTIAVINSLEASILQTAQSQEGGEVVAVINCGARTTSISIMKAGVLMFTRNIPKGGNDITRRIMESMNYDYEQANAAKASGECSVIVNEGESNELGEVIRPEIEDLVTEIRMSFDYFKAQSREPVIHRIVLTGGTANLPNFSNFLMNELGVDVDLGNPLENIGITVADTDGLYNNLQQYAVAIGLALRGVTD